jgi:hypothetical protein
VMPEENYRELTATATLIVIMQKFPSKE